MWTLNSLTITTSSGPNEKAIWGNYRKHLKERSAEGKTEKERSKMDYNYAMKFGSTFFDSTRGYKDSVMDHGKVYREMSEKQHNKRIQENLEKMRNNRK